jgi:hypothetical protein
LAKITLSSEFINLEDGWPLRNVKIKKAPGGAFHLDNSIFKDPVIEP